MLVSLSGDKMAPKKSKKIKKKAIKKKESGTSVKSQSDIISIPVSKLVLVLGILIIIGAVFALAYRISAIRTERTLYIHKARYSLISSI